MTTIRKTAPPASHPKRQTESKPAAPRKGESASAPQKSPRKSDPFGNTITWEKGDSGEKIKVFHSGEQSRWKSGVTKYDGVVAFGTVRAIQLTVPGTPWVVTIPKNNPASATADNPIADTYNRPVQLTVNPKGFRIPGELRKETFAVFDDGKGLTYGIGLDSLFFTSGKSAPAAAPEAEQKTEPPDAKENEPISPATPHFEAPEAPRVQAAPPPPRLDAGPPVDFAPPPNQENAGPAIGPRAAAAQDRLNKAVQALADAERSAGPGDLRLIQRLKQQAETYAAQSAQTSGADPDSARLLVPRFYSQLVLNAARSGELNTPALASAAGNYLKNESQLRNAYVQDAWDGIKQAWESASPEWQKYYASRWNTFYGKAPDPWQAFAADVVQNGTPSEAAMKKASENYLAYDQLRRSNMNPFLYPLAMASSSNNFGRQQFTIPGQPGTLGANGGLPDFMGGAAGSPLMEALYGNIQSSLMQSISWIANLWSIPPVCYYNFSPFTWPNMNLSRRPGGGPTYAYGWPQA